MPMIKARIVSGMIWEWEPTLSLPRHTVNDWEDVFGNFRQEVKRWLWKSFSETNLVVDGCGLAWKKVILTFDILYMCYKDLFFSDIDKNGPYKWLSTGKEPTYESFYNAREVTKHKTRESCMTTYFYRGRRASTTTRGRIGKWWGNHCIGRFTFGCMKKATRQIINEAKEKPKQSTSVGKWFLESFFFYKGGVLLNLR